MGPRQTGEGSGIDPAGNEHLGHGTRLDSPGPIGSLPKMQRLVPVLILALLSASCASPPDPIPAAASSPEPSTTVPAPAPTTTSSTTSTTTTTTTVPPPPPLHAEALEAGTALAGTVTSEVDQLGVFVFPGAPFVSRTIPAATILGTPTTVLVVEGPRNGWVRAMLPGRPNGATGWVRAGDLDLFTVDRRVEIDLGNRSLRLYVDGQPALETDVAIGTPSNPTPAGSFFVTDAVDTGNPNGPWGPYAFGLSARSDTITEFNGGDGIIAIHGTSNPASIGNAASLGCVRVPNEISELLYGVLEPGVPVIIRP